MILLIVDSVSINTIGRMDNIGFFFWGGGGGKGVSGEAILTFSFCPSSLRTTLEGENLFL